MRIVSLAAFIVSFALMLYGLLTPGERWFLPFGFVLTISVAVSSLGFWAARDLDKQTGADASPRSPYVLPHEEKEKPGGRAA